MSYFGHRTYGTLGMDLRKYHEFMDSMRESAEGTIKRLHYVPAKTLKKNLERTEKTWRRKEREAEHSEDPLLQIVNAAESHSYVPKIEALKDVIFLKSKLNRANAAARKNIIKRYVSKLNYQEIVEFSRLDNLLSQY